SCTIGKKHRRNTFFFQSSGSIRIFIIVGFHLTLNSSSNAFFGFTATHERNFFFQCKCLKYLPGLLCIGKSVCSPFIHLYVSFSAPSSSCLSLFFPSAVQNSLYNCFYLWHLIIQLSLDFSVMLVNLSSLPKFTWCQSCFAAEYSIEGLFRSKTADI